MATTFNLPELGENIESGTVTAVHVAVGDPVSKDETLLELETDKAVVEVPSPVSGTVSQVAVSEGSTLRVGELVVVIDDGSAAAPASAVPPTAKSPEAPAAVDSPPSPPVATPVAPVAPAAPPVEPDGKPRVASPSVRRLARQLGVDIKFVTPTGGGDRVTADDVRNYSPPKPAPARPAALTPASPTPRVPLPDFAKWGEVEREPMSKIRQMTADRMAAAWATVPHVTQHDTADSTEFEKLRKQHGPAVKEKGANLTPTAVLVKLVASGLVEYPQFNCSIDMDTKEIIHKKFVNIGVAVDTENGLLVPVIKNADEKNIVDIAIELSELAEKARTRKVSIAEMQGATFTVTNLGGIGGTSFTPIVNAPEVAILGVSRGGMQPVYKDGAFVPRMTMPLSLSYDHRIIDGADAARFVRWICQAIEQPVLYFS